MLIQKRTNTFETNSSSTHSFCVFGGEPQYEVVLPNKDGKLCISVSEKEFGWGYEKYSDFHTKAGYILLDLIGANPWDKEIEINFDGMQDKLDIIRRVVSRQTGISQSDIVFEIPRSVGHIDHQSIGTGENELYNENRLRDILFRKDVYLNISNDNGDMPEKDYLF